MFRACELKDQTYKKTRTLHFSDSCTIRANHSRYSRKSHIIRTNQFALLLGPISCEYHRPLNGLFRGAVFRHSGVPENSPLSLMGRFASLMGRFATLMGRFPECLNGPFFPLENPLEKQPIKKRGVKRFLRIGPFSFLT